jgi:Gpi18-like mannosyltransferase
MNIKYTYYQKISRVPPEISFTLLLFLFTRTFLSIVGIISRFSSGAIKFNSISDYYHGLIYIWSRGMDSGWYFDIAKNGFSTHVNAYGQANYCFFPFYPMMMRFVGIIIGDYYVAGIIISNLALIVACIYLFKLVKLEYEEEIALNSIKYLFLFPTAFILSAVMSESLFLAFLLICFYYAKKENWLLVGITGFFFTLTRSIGLFMVIPLLYIYLESKHFKIQDLRLNILFLALIPAATLAFCIYLYYLTGDFFAYMHIEESGWAQQYTNPLLNLISNAFSLNPYYLFGAYFTLACLILLILFYKKINISYLLLGLLAIIVPLSTYNWSIICMERYTVVIFPLFIIFAIIGKNRYIDTFQTILLAILQGALMIFWVNQVALLS